MTIQSEARQLVYNAGLPLASVPIIERLLALEQRVAELDQRKTYSPPGTSGAKFAGGCGVPGSWQKMA
jgi:hypothetical protein